MLMSLFSSFDALCAESFGQKVSLSWASEAKKQHQGSPAVVVSERKAGSPDAKEPTSSVLPSSHDATKSQDRHRQLQQKRRPRFAVELDGVHCFETIIPY